MAAVPFAPRWPLRCTCGRRPTAPAGSATSTTRPRSISSPPLSDVVGRYDGLWDFPLPYMMCVQEAPPVAFDGADDWHLHVELLPPHRNPQRLKVRASVETALGVYINDTLPESLAADLRAVDRRPLTGRASPSPRSSDPSPSPPPPPIRSERGGIV